MTRNGSFLVVAAAVLSMGLVLGNEVVYDGAYLLTGDRFVPTVEWGRLVTEPYWYQGLWRPVTLLLLGTEVALADGVYPVVLHAASLLLYSVSALLLWRTMLALGLGNQAILAATLIFAVHPVHVEVVASVVGQAEMLAAIAMLGAIWLWHRAAVRETTPAVLLGLIAAQFVAAGAKEQGYMLTAVLVGQQILMPDRLPTKAAVRWLAVLTAVSLLLWVIRADITGSFSGETPAPYIAGLSHQERVTAALGAIPHTVRLLAFPVRLGEEYSPPMLATDGKFGLLPAIGAILLGLGLLAMFLNRRKHPAISFGLWFTAVTWLPSSSLLVPAGLLLAERVLFLPTVGLSTCLAASLQVWWPQRRASTALIAVVVLALGMRSAVRMADWRDADTFYSAMTRDMPRSYRAWFVRARHELSAGRPLEAEAQLRRALTLWPHVPIVHEELGQLLRSQDRCDEAIPILRQGLELEPGRTQLRARLGECLLTTGDSAGASRVALAGMALGDSSFTVLQRRAIAGPSEGH